ncbi:MAG: DUF4160 domain-containing protein [Candidatus Hatepunaea meridiana]|nr:DUF4160 domain-containing protein [Candidatus Hatepunaea meridiana]
MPEISRFYGIIIRMFYQEHGIPHFHAVYGEYDISVGISPVRFIEGDAPARVRSFVAEWAAYNQDALMENWKRCRSGEPIKKIKPLE